MTYNELLNTVSFEDIDTCVARDAVVVDWDDRN